MYCERVSDREIPMEYVAKLIMRQLGDKFSRVKNEVLLKNHVLAAILNPRWPPEVNFFQNGALHLTQCGKSRTLSEVLLKIHVLVTILNPRWLSEVKILEKESLHLIHSEKS